MVTLIDTSAIYAYLDGRDHNHAPAVAALGDLLTAGERLVTHSYVALETTALVQRRLGMEATRVLFDDVLPIAEMVWIDEVTHHLAVSALLGSGLRDISLVDWTSFVVMREQRLDRAFAFDSDFARQGFEVIPS